MGVAEAETTSVGAHASYVGILVSLSLSLSVKMVDFFLRWSVYGTVCERGFNVGFDICCALLLKESESCDDEGQSEVLVR